MSVLPADCMCLPEQDNISNYQVKYKTALKTVDKKIVHLTYNIMRAEIIRTPSKVMKLISLFWFTVDIFAKMKFWWGLPSNIRVYTYTGIHTYIQRQSFVIVDYEKQSLWDLQKYLAFEDYSGFKHVISK